MKSWWNTVWLYCGVHAVCFKGAELARWSLMLTPSILYVSECLCIWFKTTVLGSMRQRYSSDQVFCFACLQISCCLAGPCTNTTTAGRLGQACGTQGDPPSWQGLVGAEQQVANSRCVFGFAISSWWFHNVSFMYCILGWQSHVRDWIVNGTSIHA